MSQSSQDVASLLARIAELEGENRRLRVSAFEPSSDEVVKVPPEVKPLFDQASITIRDFFRRIEIDPARARIAIDDDRYVLVRASAFTIDFVDTLVQLYSDRGEREAIGIARGFLFDIAHTIGIHDARNIHEKLGCKNPLEKLSAGPVHFAYTGWAQVDIKAASNPAPDDTFCLVYEHPYSFEASSFLRVGRRSDGPMCIMNSGYSSGWCEASFGLELTALEIKCRAAGDDSCCFVMAPPHKIAERVREHFGIDVDVLRARGYDVPTYFERKRAEEEIRRSLSRLEEAQEELVRKERLATVGLLVSGVAHEVNTPLGVAVTATGVIQEELKTLRERFDRNTLSKNDLATFFERTTKATSLVDTNLERAAAQISKFKRVAVDGATQDLRRVDLGAYVRETIESLGPLAKKGRLQVELTTEGELDCITSPGAVAQIVTNFVTNTVVHGREREGSGTELERPYLQVRIHVARVSMTKVALRYADDGRGMTDEVRAQAFQPFYTTRRSGGGSGLGLHIVTSLVTDVLRGRIDLDSAPGKGTRFDVVFSVTIPKIGDAPLSSQ